MCASMKPLWICPTCGRGFANLNQTHSCSDVRLEEHFAGRDPHVIATFHALVEAAKKSGPVTVLPEKTRIAFQVRMSYAAFTLRTRWIDGHVVLARRLESPRFRRIEFFSPRNQLHAFRLHKPSEVDAEVVRWLAEAYLVGEQKHLTEARRSARPRQGS